MELFCGGWPVNLGLFLSQNYNYLRQFIFSWNWYSLGAFNFVGKVCLLKIVNIFFYLKALIYIVFKVVWAFCHFCSFFSSNLSLLLVCVLLLLGWKHTIVLSIINEFHLFIHLYSKWDLLNDKWLFSYYIHSYVNIFQFRFLKKDFHNLTYIFIFFIIYFFNFHFDYLCW